MGGAVSDKYGWLCDGVVVLNLIVHIHEKMVAATLGSIRVKLTLDQSLSQGEHFFNPLVARKGSIPVVLDVSDAPNFQFDSISV